jgi:hypothetical protein
VDRGHGAVKDEDEGGIGSSVVGGVEGGDEIWIRTLILVFEIQTLSIG